MRSLITCPTKNALLFVRGRECPTALPSSFPVMASQLILSSQTNPKDENSLNEKNESRNNRLEFVQYNGFFYTPNILQGMEIMYKDFQPRADDVYLCSSVKTGTTWMKAILACIMKEENSSILQESNPHDLIHSLEWQCYGPNAMPNGSQVLANMPSPRLLHTHLPYDALPHGLSTSCKIIYIARNPKDAFVSYWKFLKHVLVAFNIAEGDNNSKEHVFDAFCKGLSHYGPFLDHVLSYWNPSRNKDNSNILFLTYEDLKEDTSTYVRRIADFLGRSSSLTDEGIDHISDQCSFHFLSKLDVNRDEKMQEISNFVIHNNTFFRKGEVGDWKNHFTPEMNSRLDSIIEEKMQGSGFCFRYELRDK